MPAARVFVLTVLVLAPVAAVAGAGPPPPQAQAQGANLGDRFGALDVNRNGLVERSEWRDSADAVEWLDRSHDCVLSRGGGSSPVIFVPSWPPSSCLHGQTSERRRAVPRRDPAAADASQDCTSNAAQVVDDVYQQVLGRPADPASASMTQALAAGNTTVRQIVAQVAKSPEHAEKVFWAPVVSTIYRQVLNRQPDEEELREAAGALASGRRSLHEVIARTATRAAAGEEGAVRILYRRLLGREADPQGLRDFTTLARREGIDAVARAIVASPEYQRRAPAREAQDAAAYESAVRSLYRHVLGRDPDPVGLRDLTRIAITSGFDAVVDRMVGSAEYERLYGDDVVPGRDVRYCRPAP